MSSNPRPPFGLATLTFLVVANMIGAGVFVTSGYSLASLQSPARVVTAWALGGLIATAGAVSYGQLSRVMPESGGEYLFLTRAMHPLVGFIAGWVSLIAGFTSAIALAATTLEVYLLPFASRPDWLPGDAIAIATVCFAGLCHGLYVRLGAIGQNLAVGLKLLCLVVFFVMAVWAPGGWAPGGWAMETGPADVPLWPRDLAELSAFGGSLVWISLSYLGFNAAVYVAGEARDPQRLVPLAMILGTLITTVLYLGMNAVFVYAPPYAEIVGQEEVALIAARSIGGETLGRFVQAIICFALLTSVTSMMMAAPRVYAKMADDGLMPAMMKASLRDAPSGAIAVQVALSVMIIWISSLKDLLSYLSLTLSVSAAVAVGCLLLPSIRARLPQRWTTPVALFYIVTTLGAAVFFAMLEPRKLLAMLATFAVGAVLYPIARRRNAR